MFFVATFDHHPSLTEFASVFQIRVTELDRDYGVRTTDTPGKYEVRTAALPAFGCPLNSGWGILD